ncbi:MAG: hypothetical protein K2X86_18710 [Cytophagaceae bacterium]|nr:hypothetical protein [Cytophagaceae bacterium]
MKFADFLLKKFILVYLLVFSFYSWGNTKRDTSFINQEKYNELLESVVSQINEQQQNNDNNFHFVFPPKKEDRSSFVCDYNPNSDLNEFYNTPPQTIALYTLFIEVNWYSYMEDDAKYQELFSLDKNSIDYSDFKILKDQVQVIKQQFIDDVANKSALGKDGVYVVLAMYTFSFLPDDEFVRYKIEPVIYFDQRLGADVRSRFFTYVTTLDNAAQSGADCGATQNQCCNIVAQQIKNIVLTLNEYVKNTTRPNLLEQLKVEEDPDEAIRITNLLTSVDLIKLTSSERLRILKLFSKVSLNDGNGGELAVLSILQSAPATEQDYRDILRGLKTDLLLPKLVERIHGDNFIRFINVITSFITSTIPPPSIDTYHQNILDKHFVEFDGDFWGDVLENYFNDNGEVRLTVRPVMNPIYNNDITVDPYKYINVKFVEDFTIGGKTYYASDEGIMMPAIYTYVLFNEANNNKIIIATSVTVNAVLFTVGVGELAAAIQARNALGITLAVIDMGFSSSTIVLDMTLAQELNKTESGKKILFYYNMANLFYAGSRISWSLYSSAKGASTAADDLLKSNALDDAQKESIRKIKENADDIVKRSGITSGERFIAKSGVELKTYLNSIVYKPIGKSYTGKMYHYIPEQYSDPKLIVPSSTSDVINRFRTGLYLSETKVGNLIEVNSYGGISGKTLYEFTNVQIDNLLDLTDSKIIETLGVSFEQMKLTGVANSYEFTQEIAIWAKNNGYSGIKFFGSQGSTDYINFVIFDQSTVNSAVKGSVNSTSW